jgi:hypothetical protein
LQEARAPFHKGSNEHVEHQEALFKPKLSFVSRFQELLEKAKAVSNKSQEIS